MHKDVHNDPANDLPGHNSPGRHALPEAPAYPGSHTHPGPAPQLSHPYPALHAQLGIVIPVYNEASSLAALINDWKTLLDDHQIPHQFIFIDDGSSDNSLPLLQSLAEKLPGIIVHSQHNAGHGPAIMKGYRMTEGLEWVFQIDSDHQLEVAAFLPLWQHRDQYDLLLGERVHKNSTPSRKMISFFSRLVVTALFGRRVKDVNSPYRLMRASCLYQAIQSIPDDSFAPNVLLTSWFLFSDKKVFTTPVSANLHNSPRKSRMNQYFLKGCLRSLRQSIAFRLTLAKKITHP